jgi:hypothetical protein
VLPDRRERMFAVVRHSGVACVLQAKFDHR